MKKTLIAATVMALSGAVWAQSSVTLYGVADVGVGKSEGGKVNMLSSTILNNSTSYIGFRGVEDLGGGLKAGFNFEQVIDMETGATGLGNTTLWQNAANVWLGGNWGRLQLGRATTPSYNAMRVWSVLDMPNYDPAWYSFGHVGGNVAARNNSLISYRTPSLGGFNAEVAYLFKGDNLGDSSLDKFDLGLTYVNGPISVGAAYNKVKSYKGNYALGAKYSFGSFVLGASYHNSDNWSYASLPGARGQVRGFSVGGKAMFGAFSAGLDIVRETRNNIYYQGGVLKNKKYTNGVFELKYSMSKRTSLYGIYMRASGYNNYALGVQHRF